MTAKTHKAGAVTPVTAKELKALATADTPPTTNSEREALLNAKIALEVLSSAHPWVGPNDTTVYLPTDAREYARIAMEAADKAL